MFSKELLQTSDYNKVITGAWTSTGQIGDGGAVSIVFGNDITYGECFFCCDDSGWRYKSEDGNTWTALGGYDSALYEHCRVFCLNNRFFCFMTSRTLDKVHFHYTPYASVDLPDSANCTIDGACFFNNKYYIAGTQVIDNTYMGFVRSSEDLVNWSDPVYINTTAIYSMFSTDNSIIISANGGIFITYDGINFIKVYNSIRWCEDVIFAFNKYIIIEAVSNGVNLLTTQDFENVNLIKNFPANIVTGYGSYRSICFGLNKLVIGFNTGESVVSPTANFVTTLDLKNFISETPSNFTGVDSVAYGNKRFVAVNENYPATYTCAYKLWGIE